MAAKLLAARQTFACELDGREAIVNAGTRVPAGHPLVKGREKLFEPTEAQADVEAAEQRPRSKRLRSGSRKT